MMTTDAKISVKNQSSRSIFTEYETWWCLQLCTDFESESCYCWKSRIQDSRCKVWNPGSRIQDPRSKITSPAFHFILSSPDRTIHIDKKIAEDSYIDWLVKYNDITAGKHAIVTRRSRCTRLPRTAQCWMFDPSTRLRHALPRDNKAACSYIKLVRAVHWPCIVLFLLYCTSGSYEKTVNLSLSEPRMESVSNNSVKNTVISARSCLVESLSCLVG